jgi:hypothetical protein
MKNRKEIIKGRLEQLEQELVELSRFPDDNFPEGTVIKFDKVFGSWEEAGQIPRAYPSYEQIPNVYVVGVQYGVGRHRVYNYAAIKVNGLWYTTGPKSPKGYDWDDLTEWMGNGVREIIVMQPHSSIILGKPLPKEELPLEPTKEQPLPEEGISTNN